MPCLRPAQIKRYCSEFQREIPWTNIERAEKCSARVMSLVHEPECWPCVGVAEKFQHNSSVDTLHNPYRCYRSHQVHEKQSQKPVWLEAVIVDSRRALFLSATTVAAPQRKKIRASNEKNFRFSIFSAALLQIAQLKRFLSHSLVHMARMTFSEFMWHGN